MGKKTLIIFGYIVAGVLIVTVFLHFVFASFVFSDDCSTSGMNDEMNEKYKELFKLYNDIELMQSRKVKFEAELLQLERSILSSEVALQGFREQVHCEMKDYVELLKIRQRNGETSKIKLVLNSKSISDFIFRINITSTIHRHYRELVASLDQNIELEMQLKEKLEADKREIILRKKGIEESIAEKETNIGKLEEYLQSKGSIREEYERQLKILEQKWRELKPLFASTIRSFINLIESGGLPNDVIEVNVSLGGVRGIVREEVFNQLLAEASRGQKDAAEIVLHAKDGGVYVHVPSHDVELFGYFDVFGNALTYKVQRGSFSGIEIGESGIEDLFMGGMLKVDVTHILNIMKMELLDCKVHDGYIDVGIKLKY